jgi:hypothetical protein
LVCGNIWGNWPMMPRSLIETGLLPTLLSVTVAQKNRKIAVFRDG